MIIIIKLTHFSISSVFLFCSVFIFPFSYVILIIVDPLFLLQLQGRTFLQQMKLANIKSSYKMPYFGFFLPIVGLKEKNQDVLFLENIVNM